MSPPIYVEYETFDDFSNAVGGPLLHYDTAAYSGEYKPSGKFVVRSSHDPRHPNFWRAWVVMDKGVITQVKLIKKGE